MKTKSLKKKVKIKDSFRFKSTFNLNEDIINFWEQNQLLTLRSLDFNKYLEELITLIE